MMGEASAVVESGAARPDTWWMTAYKVAKLNCKKVTRPGHHWPFYRRAASQTRPKGVLACVTAMTMAYLEKNPECPRNVSESPSRISKSY